MTGSDDNHVKARSKQSKMRLYGLAPPPLVDAGPAMAHAKRLHDEVGMSMRQIGDRSDTSLSTISELLGGKRCGRQHSGKIRRTVSERILSVRPESYVGFSDRGAMFPAVGVHRRLEALGAVGYSGQFMSVYMGYPKGSKSYVGTILKNQYTHQRMLDQVDEMYRKLRYVDPTDMGIAAEQRDRSKARAARKGWAPPGAWDDDLIDSLDARPEWTGECGSMRGVRIHRKENILPLCPACKAAQTADIEKWRGIREAKNG